MTTHDHDTEVTRSFDESQSPVAEPGPAGQHTAWAEPAEPSTAATEPSTAATEPSPPPSAPSESATAHTEPSPPPSAPSEPATAHTEPATEQSLFADDDLAGFRAQWAGVQAAFVDDPRECVHKADALVSDLVEQLTTGFTRARSRLEEQWARGEEASTEDLRVALMHYREFFERLLTV